MALILVCEDDISMRALISHILARMGHGVHVASNGQEAVDWLDQGNRPDLIILDLIMPVMDGNEFLEVLRTDKYKNLRGESCCPVLIITGFNLEEKGFRPSPPVIGVINKPVSISDIEMAVVERLESLGLAGRVSQQS